MANWMFKPLSDFSQSLEWLTDVLRTKTTEQRIALRSYPRISFSFSHKLDRPNYQKANSILMTDILCQIPDWSMRFNVTVSSGTNVNINVGPNHIFSVGNSVVLWTNDNDYDIVTVTAVSGSTITVDAVAVTGSYILMLVVEAYVSGGLTSSPDENQYASVSLEAFVNGTISYGTYTPNTYLSTPIFPFAAIIDGNLSERVTWPDESIDNDYGLVKRFKKHDKADSKISIQVLIDDTNVLNVLRWLQLMIGKLNTFYFSSKHNDFTVTKSELSSSNSVTVFGTFQYLDISNLQITFADKTISTYAISNKSAGPLTNNVPTTVITFTSTLGKAFNVNDDLKISKYYLLRHDTDRIELNHGAKDSNLISISIPCKVLG